MRAFSGGWPGLHTGMHTVYYWATLKFQHHIGVLHEGCCAELNIIWHCIFFGETKKVRWGLQVHLAHLYLITYFFRVTLSCPQWYQGSRHCLPGSIYSFQSANSSFIIYHPPTTRTCTHTQIHVHCDACWQILIDYLANYSWFINKNQIVF
jgi:hypothetical protein